MKSKKILWVSSQNFNLVLVLWTALRIHYIFLLWSIKQNEVDSFDCYFAEATSSVINYSSKILIGKCIVGNENQIISSAYWIWGQAEPHPWWFWVTIAWLPGSRVSSSSTCDHVLCYWGENLTFCVDSSYLNNFLLYWLYNIS